MKFNTLDAYVAGYLLLCGFVPQLIASNSKILFAFDKTERLQAALEDFHSGAAVKAAIYAASVKALKGQIHDMRKDKGDFHATTEHRLRV